MHLKKCNLETGFRNPEILVCRAGGKLPSGLCVRGTQVLACTED